MPILATHNQCYFCQIWFFFNLLGLKAHWISNNLKKGRHDDTKNFYAAAPNESYRQHHLNSFSFYMTGSQELIIVMVSCGHLKRGVITGVYLCCYILLCDRRTNSSSFELHPFTNEHEFILLRQQLFFFFCLLPALPRYSQHGRKHWHLVSEISGRD